MAPNYRDSYQSVNNFMKKVEIISDKLTFNSTNVIDSSQIHVTESIDSTDSSTGSIIVDGGIGIGGDINVSGSTVIGSNLTIDTGKLAIGKEYSASNVTLIFQQRMLFNFQSVKPVNVLVWIFRQMVKLDTIQVKKHLRDIVIMLGKHLIGLTNDAETTYIAGEDDTLKLFTDNNLVAEYASDGKFKFGTAIDTYSGLADFEIHSKGALLIPSGNLGERPANAANGFIRFNTTDNQYEGYSAERNDWEELGGVRNVSRKTFINATSNDEIEFYLRQG